MVVLGLLEPGHPLPPSVQTTFSTAESGRKFPKLLEHCCGFAESYRNLPETSGKFPEGLGIFRELPGSFRNLPGSFRERLVNGWVAKTQGFRRPTIQQPFTEASQTFAEASTTFREFPGSFRKLPKPSGNFPEVSGSFPILPEDFGNFLPLSAIEKAVLGGCTEVTAATGPTRAP